MKNSRAIMICLSLFAPALFVGCDSSSGGQSVHADGGAGGHAGLGGAANTGGSSGLGGTLALAGAPGTGGATAMAGMGGGVAGTGGNTGGTSAVGGTTGTGGRSATGGTTAAGGNAGSGGTTAAGGRVGSGGTPAAGGGSGDASVFADATATGGRGGQGDASVYGDSLGAGGRGGSGGASSVGGTPGGGGAVGAGGAASCTTATWDPPDTVNGNTGVIAGLQQVWDHSGATIMAAPNIKMYQVLANKGSLNYCARWVSDNPISATERKQVEALISKCDHQWLDKLNGWGCWPYSDVQVKVVLWAVKNKSVLTDWSDSEGKYVENSTADCPTDCGPWDPKQSFANCKTVRYDEFFWLDGSKTDYTGWGSATGFYMALSPFMSAAKANANTETIVAHEMGHSHGLDDFYDWQPAGWKTFVMLAGSSTVVTDTDGWMLRDVWRHVRSKYGYPGP